MSLLKADISGRIVKRINSFLEGYRQNIAILAKDSEEISYFLDSCLSTLSSRDVIYILEDLSYINAEVFFRNTSYTILNQFLSQDLSLDKLLSLCTEVLPQTAEYIKDTLKKKAVNFIDILELVNKFINESGTQCVLVVKEFTNLRNLFHSYHQDFSKFIILQKKCMVILASSAVEEAKEILGTDLHLLFGNFELISLDTFPLVDAYLGLANLLKPLSPTPHFLGFFINMLQSNSLYYELLAKEIKSLYQADNEDKSIIITVEKTLYNMNSSLYRKFINKVDILKAKYKDYQTLITLLLLVAQGYIRKTDLMFFLGVNKQNLTSKLERLLEMEYLQNVGNIYKVNDSLFSFWLDHIFRFYINCKILDTNRRAMLFLAKMREEVEMFKENFYKEKVQRIRELFASFKDDTLVIEDNRVRFPRLNKVNIISYPENRFNILVGEGDEILFAAVKEEETNDADILKFETITDSIKIKNLKKIFISLGELNSSAKLIAKESRIQLWDINQINSLLSIYRKPILV